ncbi:MAG: Kelch repeat-containing protein [Flavobacteriales bacterium]
MSTSILSPRSAVIILSLCTLGANAQTWVQKASVPGPGRFWAAATGNSTKGYAGTGRISLGSTPNPQSDVYEYDPATDVWTPLPDYPGGVQQGMAAFTIGERIFFGFGRPFIQPTNQVFEYLPATGVWEERASCPSPTAFQKGFVIGDCFYIGPVDLDGLMYRYTATTDSWAPIATFPGFYCGSQMWFVVDGKGYMGGGNSPFGATDLWHNYDPVADTWTGMAGLQPNSDQSCATTINGIAYVYNVGGNGNQMYSFNPAVNDWEMLGSYGDIRTPNGNFITIGNKGYHVFGGQQLPDTAISVNDLWEYTPGAASAVQENTTNNVQVRMAADGSAWLVGTIPMDAGNTLKVLDVDGRVLHTRSLPAGVPVNIHLTANELGAGLRIVSLRGTQQWTGRVVLAQ